MYTYFFIFIFYIFEKVYFFSQKYIVIGLNISHLLISIRFRSMQNLVRKKNSFVYVKSKHFIEVWRIVFVRFRKRAPAR